MASFPSTTPSREVAKPGMSLTKIVVLPIALPAACATAIVEVHPLRETVLQVAVSAAASVAAAVPAAASAGPPASAY